MVNNQTFMFNHFPRWRILPCKLENIPYPPTDMLQNISSSRCLRLPPKSCPQPKHDCLRVCNKVLDSWTPHYTPSTRKETVQECLEANCGSDYPKYTALASFLVVFCVLQVLFWCGKRGRKHGESNRRHRWVNPSHNLSKNKQNYLEWCHPKILDDILVKFPLNGLQNALWSRENPTNETSLHMNPIHIREFPLPFRNS